MGEAVLRGWGFVKLLPGSGMLKQITHIVHDPAEPSPPGWH